MTQDTDTVDVSVYRGQLTNTLGLALRSGKHGLDVIPGLVVLVLNNEAWKEHIIIETGEHCKGFDSFAEYAGATPPEGLGVTDLKLIERIISDDPEALILFRQAIKHQGDRTDLSDNFRYNVTEVKRGNDKAYLNERLSRERPDLYEQVKAKKISPRKAGIQAGIIKPSVNVRLDDMDSLARTLRNNLTPDQLDALIQRLRD